MSFIVFLAFKNVIPKETYDFSRYWEKVTVDCLALIRTLISSHKREHCRRGSKRMSESQGRQKGWDILLCRNDTTTAIMIPPQLWVLTLDLYENGPLAVSHEGKGLMRPKSSLLNYRLSMAPVGVRNCSVVYHQSASQAPKDSAKPRKPWLNPLCHKAKQRKAKDHGKWVCSKNQRWNTLRVT